MQRTSDGRTSQAQLITTGAAAALAACHRTTVYRAITDGELEAVRLGRRGDYRIAPEALAAWLQPTAIRKGHHMTLAERLKDA